MKIKMCGYIKTDHLTQTSNTQHINKYSFWDIMVQLLSKGGKCQNRNENWTNPTDTSQKCCTNISHNIKIFCIVGFENHREGGKTLKENSYFEEDSTL